MSTLTSFSTLPFPVRAANPSLHPLATRLLQLSASKSSNLVLSADVTSTSSLLRLADVCGPHIIMLKTHVDILSDFDYETTIAGPNGLVALARKHGFLLFEDRKFVDIGHTVQMQYAGGVYRIVDWADVVNCLLLAGPSLVGGLEGVLTKRNTGRDDRAILILSSMTSAGSLQSTEYVDTCVGAARKYDGVVGFIAPKLLEPLVSSSSEVKAGSGSAGDKDFLLFTTGVNIASAGDSWASSIKHPSRLWRRERTSASWEGIIAADDPAEAAERYKEACWRALGERWITVQA